MRGRGKKEANKNRSIRRLYLNWWLARKSWDRRNSLGAAGVRDFVIYATSWAASFFFLSFDHHLIANWWGAKFFWFVSAARGLINILWSERPNSFVGCVWIELYHSGGELGPCYYLLSFGTIFWKLESQIVLYQTIIW